MRIIGHEVKEITNGDYKGDFLVSLKISEKEREEITTLILRVSNSPYNLIEFYELHYYEGPFGTIFAKKLEHHYNEEDEACEPYKRFKSFMKDYIPARQELLLNLVDLHKKL